jgi:hypothetical protein
VFVQISCEFADVAEFFDRKARLVTDYWKKRTEVFKHDAGATTVEQLFRFLVTHGISVVDAICRVIIIYSYILLLFCGSGSASAWKEPYHFGKSDPNPHQCSKPDPVPDPYQSKFSGAVWRLKNEAMEGSGRSKWRRGGSVGQWSQICITLMRSKIRIKVKAQTRIRIMVKSRGSASVKERSRSGSAP